MADRASRPPSWAHRPGWVPDRAEGLGRSLLRLDGPVQIKPHAGSSWAPQKHPVRHRATYTRHAGVSYFFAAYNVHEDHLWMHHKPKKHASVVLTFLKAIRRRYPKARRIYLVLENGFPSRTAFCSYGYFLNAYQLKRTRGVFAITPLDFKPEGDRLLHPFDQLIN